MKLNRAKKLYVAEYKGMFKIGVTNNVKARMNSLACGCPTIKPIYESKYLSNAFEIETLLHNTYKNENIGGEWFSKVDIGEIKNTINQSGNVVNYEKLKKDETENFSAEIQGILNKFFVMPASCDNQDNRDMTLEELRYENEQIEKFTIAVSGADVPNIYSDLIYDILFGKNTEQLSREYKTSKFESFRKHLSYEQNAKIQKYTKIIGNMINAYWTFDKIKDYMEMI